MHSSFQYPRRCPRRRRRNPVRERRREDDAKGRQADAEGQVWKVRKITDHIVDGDLTAHQLRIEVTDEPGHGGASHAYRIEWHSGLCLIHFQEGPIKEHGVNGITQEALLAIVIDRLRSFQEGQYSCTANAVALANCEEALRQLQKRTRERIARGVEGTHQK
jgi:hypothetical protein